VIVPLASTNTAPPCEVAALFIVKVLSVEVKVVPDRYTAPPMFMAVFIHQVVPGSAVTIVEMAARPPPLIFDAMLLVKLQLSENVTPSPPVAVHTPPPELLATFPCHSTPEAMLQVLAESAHTPPP